MIQTTERTNRRPWLKWLGITAAVVVGLYALFIVAALALFSGTWM